MNAPRKKYEHANVAKLSIAVLKEKERWESRFSEAPKKAILEFTKEYDIGSGTAYTILDAVGIQRIRVTQGGKLPGDHEQRIEKLETHVQAILQWCFDLSTTLNISKP